MLRTLQIENYAIIDHLRIDFSKAMNVITGETGAGKSIIVGALGLILGQRADSSTLLNKQKKCIVEGIFDHEHRKSILQFLEENGLDLEDELVLRREINSNGKSRAFINDTPVNLDQLQRLSSLIVDMHQQFDTVELAESEFQLAVIDSLAGQNELLGNYRELFARLNESERKLRQLRDQKQQFDKEADYNRFQFNELEEAAFGEDEIEGIDNELKLLSNAEGIRSALGRVSFELQESETPIAQQLKSLQNSLNSFSELHNDIPSIIQRLQSAQIELQDIADEVERMGGQINYDPAKIEQLNDRLSLGYRLMKKHGVNTTKELLQVRGELGQKLQAVMDIDDEIASLEKTCGKLKEEASSLAEKISAGRKKQVKPFEDKVNKLLSRVGMPNARLKVQLAKSVQLNANGSDEVEFLFDGNIAADKGLKSGNFHPLRKVASGGERSRLMLCIKSLVAESVDLPTMIFDEIDTGISGEAARQVGIIMKELAEKRQIICITHQPQIAGKASAHYFVYKEVKGDSVRTGLRQLDIEERISAIAKMLGGEKPTAAAIENARELIN